jgi:tRNA (guanine37-N1)-methyltransferase
MLKVSIICLFEEYLKGPLACSMLKKAQDEKLLEVELINLRDFGVGKHRSVDKKPYGGGSGMLLMAEPLGNAIDSVLKSNSTVLFPSPRGSTLSSKIAKELSKKQHLIFVCGYYEGVDQRIIDIYVDREISIGDYVLTNGALSSLVILDATARFLPGLLGGGQEAHSQESFENKRLEHSQYTSPRNYNDLFVPNVLLSGNHGQIDKFKDQNATDVTRQKRPDLLE